MLAREVYTIEIVPELGEMARANLERLGYGNVSTKIGDGYQGWAERAVRD
jgi:protein-L-isoaspartate(D-aspartate) O-methyltransferase